MVVGILGVILIVIAWLIETQWLLKSEKIKEIDERFLLIYVIGAIFLTAYSVQRSDLIFMFFGALITILTLIEIVLIYIKKH